MSFKHKIIALGIVPLLFAIIAVGAQLLRQSRLLG